MKNVLLDTSYFGAQNTVSYISEGEATLHYLLALPSNTLGLSVRSCPIIYDVSATH